MSKRVRSFTAIFMISLLFPATVEIFENVVHLTLHGHSTLFHATDHQHHTTDSDCCGCPSPHVSGLNLSQLFHPSALAPDLCPPLLGRAALAIAAEKALCDGFGTIPFRPPIS